MITRRTRLAILASIPVALATLGCDSTQPDKVDAQTASLSFSSQAKVDNNDCYELWYDFDGDGVTEYTGVDRCELAGQDPKVIRPVPWRYSLVVSVIRSGKTAQEVIGSSVIVGDPIPDFVSMTPYDTIVQNAPLKAPEDGIEFKNGKRISTGNQEYLRIAGYDLGPSNVLKQSPTFDFTVYPGDTIIVQARKEAFADAPDYLPTDQNPELTITGILTVAGVRVQVNGDTTTQNTDKAGVTFSFTR